jgi:hypothetical protein
LSLLLVHCANISTIPGVLVAVAGAVFVYSAVADVISAALLVTQLLSWFLLFLASLPLLLFYCC